MLVDRWIVYYQNLLEKILVQQSQYYPVTLDWGVFFSVKAKLMAVIII